MIDYKELEKKLKERLPKFQKKYGNVYILDSNLLFDFYCEIKDSGEVIVSEKEYSEKLNIRHREQAGRNNCLQAKYNLCWTSKLMSDITKEDRADDIYSYIIDSYLELLVNKYVMALLFDHPVDSFNVDEINNNLEDYFKKDSLKNVNELKNKIMVNLL